jgi:hypothetical protein
MEVGQGPNWGCSAKEKKILKNTDFFLEYRTMDKVQKTKNPYFQTLFAYILSDQYMLHAVLALTYAVLSGYSTIQIFCLLHVPAGKCSIDTLKEAMTKGVIQK